MSTLIVTAHPDTGSLTHHAAARLQERLGAGAVIRHLAQEGFDPRFGADDRATYRAEAPSTPEIAAEQQRIDAVSDLVLVFPVYWWSMPALLKGWIDRVFVAGWAFGLEGERITGMLDRLTVHLLPVSGTTEEAFARHGYTQSFSTQIEHGILDYCGARRGITAFVWNSEAGDDERVAAEVEAAVASIAAGITTENRS